MTEKLEPCPFCGGEADQPCETRGHKNDGWWSVSCANCGVTNGGEFTREAAVAVWNTRANHPPLPEDDKALIAELNRAAKSASDAHRMMAEAKSLRQESNTERRTDLYMWPTPEQTVEGRAAARIAQLSEEVEEYQLLPSVTVGAGLSVSGEMAAIHRVQDYILLDSSHPVEKEDVRRSLARALQKVEAQLAASIQSEAKFASSLIQAKADLAQLSELSEDAAQCLQDHMEQFHGICLPASDWDAAIRAMKGITDA